MSIRTRLLISFAVFIGLFSALTLIFWEFMRDSVLIPVYYVLWVAGLVVNSIPQGAFLTLLVIVSLVIGLKTLENVRSGRRAQTVVRTPPASSTRYVHWATLCTLAYSNWFSKGRLNYEARKLVLSVIAYERGVDVIEAEAMVYDGVVILPDALAEVVTMRTIGDVPLANRFSALLQSLRHLLTRTEPTPDPQVERLIRELIQFLETRMETTHAGHNSEF